MPDIHSQSLQPRRGSRGFAAVYLIVIMVVLLLFTSLAVDYGRAQGAKTELQSAADSAARYASTGLSDGTYFTKASAVASHNYVDGTTLSLQSSDVVIGRWSGGVFTAGGTPTNAVQVTARRTAARGTAIPLLFAVGLVSVDVTASAYATYIPGQQAYGLVGLSSVNLQNNTILVNSFNSSVSSYSAGTATSNGNVATNGNMNLNGNVTIDGDLYMPSGASISSNGSVSYLARNNLSPTLSYSVASAGSASTTNNNSALSPYLSGGNFNFSSGTLNVPAGVYYMNGFSMNGGTLNINGDATFYINGNFTIQGGTVNVAGNLASNFNVNVIASAGANFTNVSSLPINLYCPTSPINVNNCANLYGSFIGSSVSVSGSCGIHEDQALMGSSGTGTIKTVE